ncbi:hypothetical protein BO71DRAFT_434830 [Aspergillus ellipticus CBS 707.79]|uniref:Uncharacterized protein n=1 Tax=Aspergillus ellipticus CBS 707.79 TaxID=1448320 RepID=A0A319CVS7_9EURO|nr:hypothetical protein BO71DRAFT_434830 [Aspergillus ellipticus CBS 707.79]
MPYPSEALQAARDFIEDGMFFISPGAVESTSNVPNLFDRSVPDVNRLWQDTVSLGRRYARPVHKPFAEGRSGIIYPGYHSRPESLLHFHIAKTQKVHDKCSDCAPESTLSDMKTEYLLSEFPDLIGVTTITHTVSFAKATYCGSGAISTKQPTILVKPNGTVCTQNDLVYKATRCYTMRVLVLRAHAEVEAYPSRRLTFETKMAPMALTSSLIPSMNQFQHPWSGRIRKNMASRMSLSLTFNQQASPPNDEQWWTTQPLSLGLFPRSHYTPLVYVSPQAIRWLDTTSRCTFEAPNSNSAKQRDFKLPADTPPSRPGGEDEEALTSRNTETGSVAETEEGWGDEANLGLLYQMPSVSTCLSQPRSEDPKRDVASTNIIRAGANPYFHRSHMDGEVPLDAYDVIHVH